MQDLCRDKYGWDHDISEENVIRWRTWLADLPKMSQISVDRCVKPPGFSEVSKVELHTFADASQIGYGAVSYLRIINTSGEVHCTFMGGRSRLAPLKIDTDAPNWWLHNL